MPYPMQLRPSQKSATNIMLETLVLQADLMRDGALSTNDEVVEIEPSIAVFEAKHRDHGTGFLVELAESETDRKFQAFFRVEEHMWPVVQELESRTDFPFLAIKGDDVHFVRRGIGMPKEPAFELCEQGSILRSNHIKTFGEG